MDKQRGMLEGLKRKYTLGINACHGCIFIWHFKHERDQRLG